MPICLYPPRGHDVSEAKPCENELKPRGKLGENGGTARGAVPGTGWPALF